MFEAASSDRSQSETNASDHRTSLTANERGLAIITMGNIYIRRGRPGGQSLASIRGFHSVVAEGRGADGKE